MHPTLFHLGHFTVPTFGLLTAIGIMAALALSLRSARLTGLSPDSAWNAGLFAVVAAFVLSRLLLIIPSAKLFLAYPILVFAIPSLTPLGVVLTAIATLAWLRLRRLPVLPTLDAWAPSVTLLWAFLALGHLAEGSDPGLPTSSFVGVRMLGETTPLHPVALYAAFVALLLTAVLFATLARPHAAGAPTALALALAGLAQFFLTFVRQPFPYENAGPLQLDPLQWVALGMIAAAAILTVSRRALLGRRSTELRSPHAV